MNDLFQERYRAPSIHTITTIYDCKRTFDKCKAALWAAAQPHHAFAKIGVGIRGRKCVCHLHDKADGLNRSERTVKTALNELENAGLITRVRQGWNRANRIFLHLPDGVQLSSPPEGNICPMEVQESSPCMGQKLPTSNTKQEYINLIQTERGEGARRRFGEYQNVFFLTMNLPGFKMLTLTNSRNISIVCRLIWKQAESITLTTTTRSESGSMRTASRNPEIAMITIIPTIKESAYEN